jgi:hypothetical protein
MSNITYNRTIRKITTAFGDLFNNITFIRYNTDSTEQERIIIPIEYATKEHYVSRLQVDPDLDKKVQVTLPKMSYMLNGITYDVSRKQNTNQKNFNYTNTGVVSQYNPVPYDLDYSLNLYVRNIEDGMQIIEHVLPYFTPDYTLNLNLIPEMGITKEIPIILKDANYEVRYEGNRQSDTRVVIWTLNFTAKAYIFGNISSGVGLIRNSITNIIDDTLTNSTVVFTVDPLGSGTYKEGEIVYQGKTPQNAIATAKVLNYINDKLYVTNLNGNFITGKSVVGSVSGANHLFVAYTSNSSILSTINITPNPLTANVNDNYTYTTIITEPGQTN